MRRLRALWSKPLARAAALFVVLALPWPFVARAYVQLLAGWLDLTLGSEHGTVALTFAADPASLWDVRARATVIETGRTVATALDAHRTGYLQTAVFTALGLTSALPVRRKALLLGSGLTLIHLLPLLPILTFFSGRLPIVVFELGLGTRVVVDLLYRALVAPLGMAYALPALVWLLLLRVLHPVEAGPALPSAPTRPSDVRARAGRRRRRLPRRA